MAANYQVWVNQAEENLKWARDNLELANYSLVGVLAQQAVELILKGYLYARRKVPSKTHNLLRLMEESKKLGLSLDRDFSEELAELSEFYFDARYPDEAAFKKIEPKQAERLLQLAEVVCKKISSRITGDDLT